MARLVGMSTDEVQTSRLEIARNFPTGHQLYVVLKGHRTLIATPDGKVFINTTGNPGMATGGTGDVLTGLIAALLAQKLDGSRRPSSASTCTASRAIWPRPTRARLP